jgi:large subunit ribosomal protein L35
MEKLKNCRSARKRFSLTGKGYISRHQTKHRHKLIKRPIKKRSTLTKLVLLTKRDELSIKTLLPYLKK